MQTTLSRGMTARRWEDTAFSIRRLLSQVFVDPRCPTPTRRGARAPIAHKQHSCQHSLTIWVTNDFPLWRLTAFTSNISSICSSFVFGFFSSRSVTVQLLFRKKAPDLFRLCLLHLFITNSWKVSNFYWWTRFRVGNLSDYGGCYRKTLDCCSQRVKVFRIGVWSLQKWTESCETLGRVSTSTSWALNGQTKKKIKLHLLLTPLKCDDRCRNAARPKKIQFINIFISFSFFFFLFSHCSGTHNLKMTLRPVVLLWNWFSRSHSHHHGPT